LGCTEPIAVAYAASVAANELDGNLEKVVITVDPGVYKNGMAVTVPNTNGQRVNLIAGVLGALVKKPKLKMEILQGVQKKMIRRTADMIRAGGRPYSMTRPAPTFTSMSGSTPVTIPPGP
jgi:L-cysteine desulfidase